MEHYDFSVSARPQSRRTVPLIGAAIVLAVFILALRGFRLQLASNHKERMLLVNSVEADELTTTGVVYRVKHTEMDDNVLNYALPGYRFLVTFRIKGGKEVCFPGPFNWLGEEAYNRRFSRVTVDVVVSACGQTYTLQSRGEDEIGMRSVSIHYLRSEPQQFYSPEIYSGQPDGQTMFRYMMSAILISVITCPLVFVIFQLVLYPLAGSPPSGIIGRCIQFLDCNQTYFEEHESRKLSKRGRPKKGQM